MDKNLIALIGAVTSAAASVSAQAALAPVTRETLSQIDSYTDLLRPIPDALAILKGAAEAAPQGDAADGGSIQRVQLPYYGQPYYQQPAYPPAYAPPAYYPPGYYYRRPYFHHHHHHHHHHHFQ